MFRQYGPNDFYNCIVKNNKITLSNSSTKIFIQTKVSLFRFVKNIVQAAIQGDNSY